MRSLGLAVLITIFLVSVASAEFTSIGSGSKTVTTPGTAVQLSSTSEGARIVYLTANYGTSLLTRDCVVYAGSASVNAGGAWGNTPSTRKGIRVLTDDVVYFDVADVSMIYIDSCHTGDGVTYTFVR